MRRILVGLLAVIGLLSLFLVGIAASVGWWVAERLGGTPSLPAEMILEVDLRRSLPEVARTPRLRLPGLERPLTVTDLVLTLDRAGADPRVKGLVADLGDGGHGFAVTQELRQAIQRFRAHGKFALAWADSFGELTPGNESYYLATAFDEIVMQPMGLVGVTGLSLEMPYVREALDSLGVEPQVVRRAEYKTAFESFTENAPTQPSREMMETLVDQLWRRLVADVAEARRLEPAAAATVLGRGPFNATEAREARLIDRLAYRDELRDSARQRAGAAAGFAAVEDYREVFEKADGGASGGKVIALVRAAGLIYRGEGEVGRNIAADELAGVLAGAIDDTEVAAIVLRLDTGGGSPVASETIARQVRRAVAAGKPMVVSMSNEAASGGYWISAGASRIVAQPATLTGSIGVLAGKPVLTEALAKLGIKLERTARGENAALWSLTQPWDQAERARVEALIEHTYVAFKARVAEGRKLDPARVEGLAKGRIWTGEAALELGLVDRLGGLSEALAEARSLLRLPADAPLDIRVLPAEELPWRALGRLLAEGTPGVLSSVTAMLEYLTTSARGGGLAVAPFIKLR